MKLFDSLQMYYDQKRTLFLRGIITYSELINDCESAVDFAIDLCEGSEKRVIFYWWKNQKIILSASYEDYK